MLSQIALIYRTVIHLKWIQIRYQIWYRFKVRFQKIDSFNDYLHLQLNPLFSSVVEILMQSSNRVSESCKFSFLNLEHQFKNKTIDWGFNEYGKLWNYNLQYFDYLQDSDLMDDFKIWLIEDCSDNLVNNKLNLEPYPVSLRLVNWILYYSKTGYKSQIFENCLKQQVSYLRNNLEYHIQANHLLENYIALSIAGLALNDKELFEFAFISVEKELEDQILSDGSHYECSPMYHSIILGKLILLYDVILNGNCFNSDLDFLKMQISKMLGWLNGFAFENHVLANFNDAIDRIAPSVIAIKMACDILGIVEKPVNLNESGYRKMKAGSFELVIDAGNIIPSYQPGHAHSDMLSFCMQFKGEVVFTDMAISTYQQNSQREFERSTMAHNTVTVNNDNQSEVWGSFRVGKRAVLQIEDDNDKLLIASHDGYVGKYGLKHRRTFSTNNDSIIIKDELLGKAFFCTKNVARLYLTSEFLPRIEIFENKIILTNGIVISFEGADNICIQAYNRPIAYNQFQESSMIEIEFSTLLVTTIEQE